MRRAPQAGDGRRRGVSPESEALLNALKPFCMSVVMAMEELLNSEGDVPPHSRPTPPTSSAAAEAAGVIYSHEQQASLSSSPTISAGDSVAARVASGRRLESALASLRSALSALVSAPALGLPSSASSLSSGFLRRAFPPALPFVMLPLELALSPPGRRNTSGASTAEGREV
ncbi:unnamed protein product, partial [Scytosiphon promiscuus]